MITAVKIMLWDLFVSLHMRNTKTKKIICFQFSLKSEIIKALKEIGFNHPNTIQEKVIPQFYGLDFLAISNLQSPTL